MGKILIKNKKGSHEKPAQNKKTTAAATPEQPTATTTAAPAQVTNTAPQDPANPAPSTQENQGGQERHQAKSDYIP